MTIYQLNNVISYHLLFICNRKKANILKKFLLYKNVSDEIIQVLNKYNCSNSYDIQVIYNIIMGFPYILGNGCLYKGKYYNKLSDLPDEAKFDFKHRYMDGFCSVDPNIIDEI